MKKKKSFLYEGNLMFREQCYKEAKQKYEDALLESEGVLQETIYFNLKMVAERYSDESIKKGEIIKPECLDEYSFQEIKKSGFFDPVFYLEKYSDEVKNEKNLLEHYLKEGVKKGFSASAYFDAEYYLRMNPDIKEAGINPFIHYVFNGKEEGREAVAKPYRSSYTVSEIEYIPRLSKTEPQPEMLVKPICFYLPQFHPIPENDEWWGKGFTEWTNVKPAKPQFEGHYQPRIPHDDIGYYSLLDRETQAKQIELAKQYGIGGFCYYLYWFSGHRLLETPLDNMLADPSLDFPFCVCWANENWSRRWDGLDHDLLMVQNYSEEDDIEFIKNIAKYLKDSRYIKIDGKPMLLIYRPNLFPDMKKTVKRWRDWCKQNGVGDIYLVYPQSFETVDPSEYDFDAACEFPPNNSQPPKIIDQVECLSDDFEGMIFDWRVFLERSDNYDKKPYKFFRSATPSWDNTARKKNKGMIFHNSCPKLFTKNLVNAFSETIRANDNSDERLVFINAWNEWAEGAYLEPDQRYGYAWLQAVKDAHKKIEVAIEKKLAIVIHAFYPEILDEILSDLNWVLEVKVNIYITTTTDKFEVMKDVASKYNYPTSLHSFENHGRDVLPFLKVMPKVVEDRNEYLIKIHTKKSLHRDDGDSWRQEIYGQLLSMGMYVRAIDMFENDKDIAMISPDGNLVPISYYWGSNEKNVLKLCEQYNINFDKNAEYKFIAGTMFLAKVKLFEKMLNDLMIKDELFEMENNQVDGTLAHAYERFFGIYASSNALKLEAFKAVNKGFKFAKITKEECKNNATC